MDVDGFATNLLLLCPGDESVVPATVALRVWSTTPPAAAALKISIHIR